MGAVINGIISLSFGLVGCWTPECGHTYLARGNDKVYFLRSLADGSFLSIYDSTGTKLIGEYPTCGKHSCHITLLMHQAVVCDYTSGTLSLYNLDSDGIPCEDSCVLYFKGSGPDTVRQAGSHIHSSWVSADGDFLIVADLGSDKLYRFTIRNGAVDVTSREDFEAPAGCGPRHCAFSADGRNLYVSTELSDEILVYSYPEMNLVQRVEVNPLHPRGGGHIALHPNGRFLYVSSRLKGDGIAVFSIRQDGQLDKVGYMNTGDHPRHFAISEDGTSLIVACRDSNAVEVYGIESNTGLPFPISESIAIEKPVFIIL